MKRDIGLLWYQEVLYYRSTYDKCERLNRDETVTLRINKYKIVHTGGRTIIKTL